MNAEQARGILDIMTGTIEQESAMTRKVIAAVPNGNRDYKPDPKSRTAWEPETPAEMTDPAAVAKWHEKELSGRLAKIRALPAEDLLKVVDFFGTSTPAIGTIVFMNNHQIHHRGQLAAYLRAAGSKVPAIYGMSADENMFAPA